VPPEPVDHLRAQLRDRGYLTHGIERWFALDPWRSRTFWLELTIGAAKAAALIAAFAALPAVAIMLSRNHPLSAIETLLMTLMYGAASFAAALAFIILIALVLKIRPELAVDTPPALLAISLGASAVICAPLAIWWYRFDAPPAVGELAIGVALIAILFLISTIVVSAALLTFSVYELQRVPAIHQRSRTTPMAIAAVLLIALLFLPAYAAQEKRAPEPPVQVVTTPANRRIAFVAVDGLTYEIFHSRPALVGAFASAVRAAPIGGQSATDRWATAGTGVPPRVHGVHSIEGIRFRGGAHVLQSLSRDDFVLHDVAPALALARREPLPPTVRRRDYIWEILAARGTTSVSVNWWTTEDVRNGALHEIGQESIFGAARGDALKVDREAAKRLIAAVDAESPSFATVYLPALDVVLNRLPLDESARLAASVQALDGIVATVAALEHRGYAVYLLGMPGDRQRGNAVIASPAGSAPAQPFDVAPTLLALLGFPASNEMPGSVAGAAEPPRIATYGNRNASTRSTKVDQDYYDNLKSLGYIR
jgi:hypothetical protein